MIPPYPGGGQPPYPGPPPRPPMRTSSIWAGIGLAVLAQAVLAAGVIGALAATEGRAFAEVTTVGLAIEALLFVAALVGGILLINKGDRGLGVGLITGWAIGAVAVPVVGFGVCVYALSQTGL